MTKPAICECSRLWLRLREWLDRIDAGAEVETANGTVDVQAVRDLIDRGGGTLEDEFRLLNEFEGIIFGQARA